jgi:hypothetical protein
VNGNVNSASSTVLVKDTVRPTLITKNISVTLSGGVATITAASVNNGSFDNCSIASMSVTPNSFTCANIGNNTVTLTVTDANGNVNTGTAVVSVNGSGPTVTISQNNLPGFCQGGMIVLKTSTTNNVVSYLWNNGKTTPDISVNASGTYSVTVTNVNGCIATASTTVSYNAQNLLSSYTIIATLDNQNNQVGLKHGTEVQSGGVGAIGSNGQIQLTEESKIVASGTFARAVNIDITGNSAVTNKYYSNPSLSLPSFKYNPYCSSSNNKTVAAATTVTISDSVIGTVSMGQGSTIIFTSPVLYIKSLSSHPQGGTIKFTSSCVEIRICNELDLKEDMSFNPDQSSVVIYCGGKFDMKKGSTFNGSVYSLDEIKVEANANYPSYLKGLFIGTKVESHYAYWNLNTNCGSCTSNNKTRDDLSSDESGLIKGDAVSLNIYPVPNSGKFSIDLITNTTGKMNLDIYDYTGKLVYRLNDIGYKGFTNIPVELASASSGYYLVRIEAGGKVFNRKIMILRD